jgi:hypothetical protein
MSVTRTKQKNGHQVMVVELAGEDEVREYTQFALRSRRLRASGRVCLSKFFKVEEPEDTWYIVSTVNDTAPAEEERDTAHCDVILRKLSK